MAKELPYFKFEPGEWENGNIQMLSRDQKGLFIDLCSMYWSRLGDVPFKLAMRKLCDGNATALNSLLDEGIIKVENDYLRIDFLEIQLSEFNQVSSKNSENAKIGWEKRRKHKALSERNATALNSQCENDAIREDKSIEDKSIIVEQKKLDNTKIDFDKLLQFINQATGRNFKVINKAVKGKYIARLKEGYTKDQIIKAVVNACKDKNHIENGFKYLTPEFFSRPDKIEMHGSEQTNQPITFTK